MMVLPGVDVQAAVAFLVEDEHRYANGHCTRQAPVDPRMTCNKLLHCDVKQRMAMVILLNYARNKVIYVRTCS